MIDECWLIPALSIGISEELFWTKSPLTIEPYFKAYELKRKRNDIDNDILAWRIGAYVSSAIRSNVFIAGLADKDTPKNMPSYPESPYSIKEMSDKEKPQLTNSQRLLIEKFKNAEKKLGKGE